MRLDHYHHAVMVELSAERAKQNTLWGTTNYDPLYWVGILAEELGEVAREAVEFGGESYRAELVHVAAVAISAMECFDRRREVQP